MATEQLALAANGSALCGCETPKPARASGPLQYNWRPSRVHPQQVLCGLCGSAEYHALVKSGRNGEQWWKQRQKHFQR